MKEVVHTVNVEFGDCDPARIVWFPNFFRWIDAASRHFFIGCGVTVYHGVLGLLTPRMPELGATTFVVLGVSFVVEGSSLLFALIPALKKARGISFWKYLRVKADPATLAVLLEDGAALVGLLVATAGVSLAWFTQNGLWDAIGSLVIGALLGVIAVILVIALTSCHFGTSVISSSLRR